MDTPFAFSTATSMSDLREPAIQEEEEGEEEEIEGDGEDEDGEEHGQPDGGDEDDNRDEVDCQVAVGEEESSELVQE